MKNKRLILTLSILVSLLLVFSACNINPNNQGSNTLPSWNEGNTKQAIIEYVQRVTRKDSPDFIPPEDRIAAFDNDGTLWPEQPVIEGEFIKWRVLKMIQQDPGLAQKQPFKALAEKDEAYFAKEGLKALEALVSAAQSGMSTEKFNAEIKEFFAGFTYPRYDLKGSQLAYKPQVELLNYLRANGFRTYICTGGDIDFVRAISMECYGIPPEQVIGSAMKYTFDEKTSNLIRSAGMLRMNDQATKPEGIQLHIGKRPVFACGNERSSGDIQMLEFSQGSRYHSFQLLVNHNDAEREFSYSEPDNASLNAAAAKQWHVVDMAKDWGIVFSK